jgi:hypothetical protein
LCIAITFKRRGNLMKEAQAITEIKKECRQLEKRMQELGKEAASIVELSGRLAELMENIESTREKQKNTWNPAAETRMKFMKKGIKLGKELNYFDSEIAKEFDKGNISKEMVEKFVSIIVHIRQNKIPAAKSEFAYFEDIVELNRRYEHAKEELDKKENLLKREINRIKRSLEEISALEKIAIDQEKVRKYEQILKLINALEEIRIEYLNSFVSKPVVQLLQNVERHPLKDQWPEFPSSEEMLQLRDFFSQHEEIGQYNVNQLCELFNFSEKRLLHIMPETKDFRKTALAKRSWFEAMKSLDQTSFLAIDIKNEAILNFYAENIFGAKEIVEQISPLAAGVQSFKEAYQKNKEFQERKSMLSKYSKNNLKADLLERESLLELLHSQLKEEKKEESGLFSKIKSFFK